MTDRQSEPQGQMLSPSPGALRSVFARYAMGGLAVLMVALAAYAAYVLRYVALIFVIAGMLGFGLGFPVNWLARKMHRVLAVIIVSVASLLLLAAMVAVIVPTLINQGSSLYEAIPSLTTKVMEALRGWQITLIPGEKLQVFDYISAFWTEYSATWTESAPQMLSGVFDYGQLVFDVSAAAVVALVVIPILTLYILLDGPRIRRALLMLLPDQSQETAGNMLVAINRSVGGFILGRLGMALFVGICFTILMFFAGLKEYALLIGLIGMLGEIVPVLGPIITFIPIPLLILASTPEEGMAIRLVWVSLVIFGIHIIKDYVVQTKLMSESMDLHPLTVLAALLIGGTIGHVVGLIIAVPVAAVIKLLVVYYVNHRRGYSLPFGAELKDSEEQPAPPPAG